VLARILGASVAGGYNLAYNVAVVPPMKLNPRVCRVDLEKLRQLLQAFGGGIINFPVLLGLMVVSSNFVPLVFGEKWAASFLSCNCCALWGCCVRWAIRLVRC
jgi:lipopolysaccharide exporter